METLNIYTDGGAKGNPGPAAIGIVFKNEKGEIIWQKNQSIGQATNNQAEYEAILYALKHANRYHPKKIRVFSDSELVVKQLQGKYKIKEPDIQKLFLRAWNKKLDFQDIEFHLIPREQNQEADRLVKSILNQKSLDI